MLAGKMTAHARLAWAAVGGLLLTLAVPGFGQDRYADEAREDEPQRPAGFWPSERLWNNVFSRMADDLKDQYELDEYQLVEVRSILQDRLPRFFDENRDEIVPLMTEYMEALTAKEPPSKEMVADWAQRVMPLMEEFRGVIENTAADMGEQMTDDQRMLLDADLAAFKVGLNMATNRVQSWANGNFDPERDWIHGSQARETERERRHEMRQAMRQAREDAIARHRNPQQAAEAQRARAKGGQASMPEDELRAYVEQFIVKYQLNDEQQQRAYQYLEAAQQRRDRYLDQKQEQMARVQELYEEAKTERDVQRAEAQYARLNAPLERNFELLKSKLKPLPTRAQRRAAEEREAANQATAESQHTEAAAANGAP